MARVGLVTVSLRKSIMAFPYYFKGDADCFT